MKLTFAYGERETLAYEQYTRAARVHLEERGGGWYRVTLRGGYDGYRFMELTDSSNRVAFPNKDQAIKVGLWWAHKLHFQIVQKYMGVSF